MSLARMRFGGGWPPLRRTYVHLLALLTLLSFGGGGLWLVRNVQGRDLRAVLLGGTPPHVHLLLGTAAGVFIALAAWWIVARPFMASTRLRYARLIGPLMGHRTDRVLISICAGVGEELFFRGALQFWLGIPLTAAVFVALHGYLDPRDRRTMTYGLFMTVAMMGLGWMAQRFGLLAPMLAHSLIDVVLLERLHAWWRAEAPPE